MTVAALSAIFINKEMPSGRSKSRSASAKRARKPAAVKVRSPAKSASRTAPDSETASPKSPKKPTQAQLYAAVLKARISALEGTRSEQIRDSAPTLAPTVKPSGEFIKKTIAAIQGAAIKQPATIEKARALVEKDPYDLLVADVNAPRAANTFLPAFAANLRDLVQFKQKKYQVALKNIDSDLAELERQQSLLTKEERSESSDRYRILALKSARARLNELSLTAQSYGDIFFPAPGAKDTTEIHAVRNEMAGKSGATPTEAWYGLVTGRLKWVLQSPQGFGGLASKAQQPVRSALAKLVRSLAKGYAVFERKYYNMVLMGPPGIGKTRLARIIGFIMSNLLVLFNNKIIELSASSFTAEFEGQTGAKTLNLLMNGLESVIFLDEAYTLPRCNPAGGPPPTGGANYGAEAITEIVQFMSTYKGLYMMIVAGYERPMKECFLVSNEGFQRRFDSSYRIVLPPYEPADMHLIFAYNLKRDVPDLTPLEKALLDEVLLRPGTGLIALGLFPSNASDIEALVSEITGAVSNQYDAFAQMPDPKDTQRAIARMYALLQGLNDYTLSRGVRVDLEGLTDPTRDFGFVAYKAANTAAAGPGGAKSRSRK